MKKIIVPILALFCASAFAQLAVKPGQQPLNPVPGAAMHQNKLSFDQEKSDRVQMLTNQIARMTTLKDCIAKASSPEAMQQCMPKMNMVQKPAGTPIVQPMPKK